MTNKSHPIQSRKKEVLMKRVPGTLYAIENYLITYGENIRFVFSQINGRDRAEKAFALFGATQNFRGNNPKNVVFKDELDGTITVKITF